MNANFRIGGFLMGLLNNAIIDNSIATAKEMIDKEKNNRLADITTIFTLLLHGRTDSNCLFYDLPLDVIAEIADNGLSLTEKLSIFQWCEIKPKPKTKEINGIDMKELHKNLGNIRKAIVGDFSDGESSWDDIS
jgi:hypothetical protein